jgi:hypothetical protein
MTYVALGVSGLALAFTIASFWWLHARTGPLEAAAPRSYAFADKVRLRLPFAFFNTGAKALIVTDLRLLVDDPDRQPLGWITTRSKLRPDSQDGFAFATPFSVPGRGTMEVIAEFGNDHGWSPEPSSRHWIHLQARVHPSETWEDILAFEWWAPPSSDAMSRYITYANAMTQPAATSSARTQEQPPAPESSMVSDETVARRSAL